MAGTGIHTAQLLLLLLLLFVAVFAVLARKLQTPYPIVLVVAGLLLGFVPAIPKITLDPDVIFLVVLPPLLYAAAWLTSWRDLRYNMVSIAMLAIGLVSFTVLGVAVVGPWLFTGFDWRVGFVLGATVATTDAIAATSIAKRVGLPKRIVDLLEGESLVNDATGLLALEFATALVVDGHQPTAAAGLLRFAYLSVGGILIGFAMGWLVDWFEKRIDDGPIEIAVSILVPYAAYLTAEQLHASGVLAVVVTGLYLGRRSSRFFSAGVRLEVYAFWNSFTFILNGFVFVLIGLQLPSVLAGVSELSRKELILYAGLFSVFLILLRILWTYPGAWFSYFIRTRLLHQKENCPAPRQIFVLGWTGMRGVIALAAAMSLPRMTADGSPFPHRDLVIFLTFSVILVTLVVQGLTLPPLIRWLGLAGSVGTRCEEKEARRLVLDAAVARLSAIREGSSPDGKESASNADLYDDIAMHYRLRLASVDGNGHSKDQADNVHYTQFLDVSRELLGVERQTVLSLRDEGRITDEVLREIERELDLNESRLIAASRHQL